MESTAERKLRRRVARYEVQELMKEKRSEELESLEEVFDRSTLMIVYKLLNRGYLKNIHGVLRAGKEARIYWGLGKGRKLVAIKIFLTTSREFKKGRLAYIQGDQRFKNVRRDTRSLVNLWALKEFKNLQQAHSAGVRVPVPIKVMGNVLLMEFIGNHDGPAPLLRETPLNHPARVYDKIAESTRRLFQKAQLVHGDLSEYNIMMVGLDPVLIDFAQAVTVEHPMAHVFLERDLAQLNQYFQNIGVTVPPLERLKKWVTGQNGD
ncbi:MAG TPA: serine protein kinase RIO [Methylomirabilota bacterium]|nr:serine protein kinase RIO [Methylomirabilota bacterium]